MIEYLRKENRQKLDELNLPKFTTKIKVMIMEPDMPYDLGFLDIKEAIKIDSYAMHPSWTAQVIKIINPDAELYASTIDFPAVVDYCIKNNIKIINASFNSTDTKERREALEKYYKWGGIFVGAAGNNYSSSVRFPANSPHTIAVGATNDETSKGDALDVYAESKYYVRNKDEGFFHFYNGTSGASPVIAGCISLMLAKHPNWNCEDVRKFLKENSKPFDEFAGAFSFPDNFRLEDNAPSPEVPKEDESMFKDVKETDWFHKAVKWAKDKGILKGYPDGTFKPNEPLTRAEYAQAEYNKAHKEDK